MEQMPAIGILTHFNSFQAGYALAVGWLERARLLDYMGVDFGFLVNETAAKGMYPNQREVLGRISANEPFEKRVEFFVDNYMDVLEPYDIILTADLIYQGKGNFLAWNAAMREANRRFKKQGKPKFWCHWIHSGWTNHKNAPYPEILRYKMMEDSILVYMNRSEQRGVMNQYKAAKQDVWCVHNPKDIRSFREFDPLAWEVTTKLNLADKDIIQILPHCSTRASAKGVSEVGAIFGALKRAGRKVALILANANARSAAFDIQLKKDQFKSYGLEDGKDFLFTSDLTENAAPLPRKAVADLFGVSNLFAFASWREVCPNVLLEARISGCQLAVSTGLPCAKEFGGDGAIYFDSTAKLPGIPDGKNDMKKVRSNWDRIASTIIPKVPDRSHMWEYSFERIWTTQFKPLLDEAEKRRRRNL